MEMFGVPDGTILNQIARARAALLRLGAARPACSAIVSEMAMLRQPNPCHCDSTLLTIKTSCLNTGNVIAVSPGTSGLQYRFLTTERTDRNDAHENGWRGLLWRSFTSLAFSSAFIHARCPSEAGAFECQDGLFVALQVFIWYVSVMGFSPRFTRLVAL